MRARQERHLIRIDDARVHEAEDPAGREIFGFSDPEDAYRRGFQQGAHMAVRSIENGAEVEEVRRWVDRKVYIWRFLTDPLRSAVQPPWAPKTEPEH